MTTERVAFRGPGEPIRVDVAIRDAARAVAELFPLAGPDEGGPADMTLALGEDGPELRLSGGTWSAPSLPAILTRLELCVAEELARRSGHMTLHAGGVGLGRGALLFAGASGSGKSSLTAGMARGGRPVLGDDAVLLDDRGRVLPLPRRLKVEEPARTVLGLPAPEGPLAGLWPEVALYTPRELGSRWAEPCHVRVVVLPERGSTGTSLTPLEPPEALREVLGHVLLDERITNEAFRAASAALSEARCYRLAFAETPSALEALEKELA